MNPRTLKILARGFVVLVALSILGVAVWQAHVGNPIVLVVLFIPAVAVACGYAAMVLRDFLEWAFSPLEEPDEV